MPQWASLQGTVAKIIKGFGTTNATLKRGSTSREIACVVLQVTALERRGNNLMQWSDKRVLISAKDLTTPPDNEQDTIFIAGIEHKIIQPPTPLQPDGSTTLYWEVFARTTDQ